MVEYIYIELLLSSSSAPVLQAVSSVIDGDNFFSLVILFAMERKHCECIRWNAPYVAVCRL